jgi:hypothetical protein
MNKSQTFRRFRNERDEAGVPPAEVTERSRQDAGAPHKAARHPVHRNIQKPAQTKSREINEFYSISAGMTIYSAIP